METTVEQSNKAIKSMLKAYHGKAYKVIMDNYLSNIQLFKELKYMEVGAIAAITH